MSCTAPGGLRLVGLSDEARPEDLGSVPWAAPGFGQRFGRRFAKIPWGFQRRFPMNDTEYPYRIYQ